MLRKEEGFQTKNPLPATLEKLNRKLEERGEKSKNGCSQ